MSDIQMRIILSVLGADQTASNIKGVAATLDASTGLAKSILHVGEEAAEMGVKFTEAAVHAAGDFQQMTTTLVTSAGESVENLSMIRQGMLDISVAAATSTEELSGAMYQIESSGAHGADALNELRVAAEGAKSENADLTTVAKAMTTVMTDYHMKSTDASKAMNGLIAVVSNGKTTLEQLSGSMGAVLPIASSLHIPFEQVGGAMATMTNAGMTARVAAQNLAHVLLSLESPSGIATKSMQTVGLSAQEVKDALENKGLPQALQMIEDHVGKKFPAGSVEYETALKNILGGQVGFKLAAMLTGESLQKTEQNIKSISGAMKDGSGAVMGFELVQQNFNFKLGQAREEFNALLIKVGTQLLPVLGQLLDKVMPLIERFGEWLVKSGVLQSAMSFLVSTLMVVINVVSTVVHFFQQNAWAMNILIVVLIAVGGAIMGVLVVAFIAWAVAAGIAAIATLAAIWPILLIGAIIALVVAGIIWAVMNWGKIVAWLQGVWAGFSTWFMGLWNTVSTWFMGALRATGSFFVGLWQGIVSFFVNLWQGVVSFFVGIWNGIVAIFQAAWNFLVAAAQFGANLLFQFIFGPFILIGKLFVWLYEHNYYFKALVDKIVQLFGMVVAWAKNLWSGFVSWLAGIWSAISSTASSIWTGISNFFTGIWTGISSKAQEIWGNVSSTVQQKSSEAGNFIHDNWSKASDFFHEKTVQFGSFLLTTWNTLSAIASKLWNDYIKPPLEKWWTDLTVWWGNLASKAAQLGSNLVNWIVGAVKNVGGAIGQAIRDAINSALAAMGFHDLPGWITGHASGILNSPTGHMAIVGERGPELMYVPQGASIFPAGSFGSGSIGSGAMIPGAGGGGPVFIISINTMAGSPAEVKRMVDLLERELASRFRVQTSSWASGGIS